MIGEFFFFLKLFLVLLFYGLKEKFFINKIIIFNNNNLKINHNEHEFREIVSSSNIDADMDDELFYFFLIDLSDFIILYWLITSVF